MPIELRVQSKDGEPGFREEELTRPITDFTKNQTMTMLLMENDGSPSIIFASKCYAGTLFMQADLEELMSGVMMAMRVAEEQFGWSRPDGYGNPLAMPTDARRAVLESIKKELETLDNV